MSNEQMVRKIVETTLNAYRSSNEDNEFIALMATETIKAQGGFRSSKQPEPASAPALDDGPQDVSERVGWLYKVNLYLDDDDGNAYLYCEPCEDSIHDDVSNLNVHQLVALVDEHYMEKHA